MPNQFDRIIQENFRSPALSLLKMLLGAEVVGTVDLPRKIQRTLEREMDMLVRITLPGLQQRIVNIEWQTTNDARICQRMLLYHALIANSHTTPAMGLVIYIGSDKMSMKSELRFDNLNYRFDLVDIKQIGPEIFLRSEAI